MRLLFILLILLTLVACITTQKEKLKTCAYICRNGVDEYSDEDLTCHCFHKESKAHEVESTQ